jgi:hypothetical protein
MDIESKTEPAVRRGMPWLLALLLITAAFGGGIALQRYLPAAQQQDPELTEGLGGLGAGPLPQCLKELKQNPDNQALRERIVRMVAAGEAKPDLPAEARNHHSRAQDLFIRAETIEDVGRAVDEFAAALLLAPWWPEAYRDMAFALEMAQQRREAIAALRLYLLARPGAADARVVQDRVRNIEASLRRSDVSPQKAQVGCEVLVPRLADQYWVYLDGRLVSSSPPGQKLSRYVRITTSKGLLFMDAKGTAARVSTRGTVTYVRRSAREEFYARKTLFIDPGSHKLELLFLNGQGYPLVVSSKNISVQPGTPAKFELGMPAKYKYFAQPVAAVALPPRRNWREEFNDKQKELRSRITDFAADPAARALHQVLVGMRVSPPQRPVVTVNLPEDLGGRRELDTRLVDALVSYLRSKHYANKWLWTPYSGYSAEYRRALAGLRAIGEAHNQRVEKLKGISELLKKAGRAAKR